MAYQSARQLSDSGEVTASYLTDSVEDLMDATQTIMSVDSLHKLGKDGYKLGASVVILDESEGIASHLVHSQTMSPKMSGDASKRMRNMSVLGAAINQAKVIICCDADFGPLSQLLMAEPISQHKVPVVVRDYIHKKPTVGTIGDVTYHKSIELMLEQLVADVEKGLRVAVFCSTTKKLAVVEEKLKDVVEKEKLMKVVGATPEGQKEAYMRNVDEAIERMQPKVLLYNTAAGTGIDIAKPYFHKTYAHIGNNPLSARDMLQAMFRVRKHVGRDGLEFHIQMDSSMRASFKDLAKMETVASSLLELKYVAIKSATMQARFLTALDIDTLTGRLTLRDDARFVRLAAVAHAANRVGKKFAREIIEAYFADAGYTIHDSDEKAGKALKRKHSLLKDDAVISMAAKATEMHNDRRDELLATYGFEETECPPLMYRLKYCSVDKMMATDAYVQLQWDGDARRFDIDRVEQVDEFGPASLDGGLFHASINKLEDARFMYSLAKAVGYTTESGVFGDFKYRHNAIVENPELPSEKMTAADFLKRIDEFKPAWCTSVPKLQGSRLKKNAHLSVMSVVKKYFGTVPDVHHLWIFRRWAEKNGRSLPEKFKAWLPEDPWPAVFAEDAAPEVVEGAYPVDVLKAKKRKQK